MTCKEMLAKYFEESGVSYQSFQQRSAYTAQEVAAAGHIPGRLVAKVVMVVIDGQMRMFALPAHRRLDFGKVKAAISAKEVRLATEAEFAAVFPECDVGAMPPFGNLYSIPVYVDRSLTEDPEIFFLAGTHEDTMKVNYQDYQRLVDPEVGDFVISA